MKATTKKNLTRLKELASAGDKIIYERVKLAAEIVADDDYLATEFKGDQDKAMEYLEGQYFVSLAGYVKLHKLLAIFKMFPNETQWQEYRYDLRAMEILYDQQRREEEREQRMSPKRITKDEFQEVADKLNVKEFELKREREIASEKDKTIADLREENTRLRQRVAELEGELRGLRSLQAA